RALSASLAGSLGVGNIAGVAVAIILGGAGAVFWIWASALVSMVLKYCEITLGVKYRKKSGGGFCGGPMFYMREGLGGAAGKASALLFAAAGVVSSFALGNIVQIKAAVDSAYYIFGADKIIFGAASALIIALIILGGFERISRFTAAVLPVISGVYIALCLAALLREAEYIPVVLSEIFTEAFRFDSAAGGVLGFLLSKNVAEGVAKGTFSHESGSGTAPMAHAGAQTDMPARQGLLGLFEVFLDTIVICSLSAFVLLAAKEKCVYEENGMSFVLAAFENSLGAWTKYVLGASVAVFALATVICWAFYGKTCLAYITPSKKAETAYTLVYLTVIIFGASLSQSAAWRISDAAIALMTAVNLPALFFLRKEIRAETKTLFAKEKRR
ncbi:MAG: amino acid carrier protein, partial [Clostridia bacterium]|nr:amino acid carrier protein [Clostridia bacterium]